MFNAKMKEAQQSEIEIQDIGAGTFKQILEYLYTDNLEFNQESLVDLLIAANKYQLQRLKNLCESRLVKHINMDSIIDLLQYSHKHNASELRKCCMNFALKNFETVIKLPNFENLSKAVMVELLRNK